MQVAVAAVNSGLVAFPVGYELVWEWAPSKPGDPGVALWRPIPPPGYVALGCVASSGFPAAAGGAGGGAGEAGQGNTGAGGVGSGSGSGSAPPPPPLRSVGCVHAHAAVDASLGHCLLLPPHAPPAEAAAEAAAAAVDTPARAHSQAAQQWQQRSAWTIQNLGCTFEVAGPGEVRPQVPLFDLRSPLGVPPAALTPEEELTRRTEAADAAAARDHAPALMPGAAPRQAAVQGEGQAAGAGAGMQGARAGAGMQGVGAGVPAAAHQGQQVAGAGAGTGLAAGARPGGADAPLQAGGGKGGDFMAAAAAAAATAKAAAASAQPKAPGATVGAGTTQGASLTVPANPAGASTPASAAAAPATAPSPAPSTAPTPGQGEVVLGAGTVVEAVAAPAAALSAAVVTALGPAGLPPAPPPALLPQVHLSRAAQSLFLERRKKHISVAASQVSCHEVGFQVLGCWVAGWLLFVERRKRHMIVAASQMSCCQVCLHT